MSNIFNDFIHQVIQGDSVKGWDHASKLFVSGNYALAPKNTFLYHVYFDINPNALVLNNVREGARPVELGMMVKQVSLPKYSIETKALNAYNRKHIVQTKINYDPVNITFHDDASNVVRNFWFDYYSYYYRNSDGGTSQDLQALNATHDEITTPRQQQDWGYTIRGSQTGTVVKAPYLSSIRIYSLFNKEFSEYVLVNPIIKSFSHGEHNSSEGAGTLSHQMTVEYETVLYAYGSVDGNVVGFGNDHYDHSPSPLTPAGGGTKSIFGQGGVAQSVGEIGKDLVTGNIGSAIFKGARVGNTLKGADLGSMLLPEVVSMTRTALSGANPFGGVNVPGLSGLFTGATPPRAVGINDLQTGVGNSGGPYAAYGSTSSTGGTGIPSLSNALSTVSNNITRTVSNISTGVSSLTNAVSTGLKGIMPANLSTSSVSAILSDDTRSVNTSSLSGIDAASKNS